MTGSETELPPISLGVEGTKQKISCIKTKAASVISVPSPQAYTLHWAPDTKETVQTMHM